MTVKPLVFEDFKDKVGQSFALAEQNGPAISFTLAEAQPLRSPTLPGVRPPFSLIFVAQHPIILPQRLYRMEHEALGAVSIFLVPVGKDARGISYQAVFN